MNTSSDGLARLIKFRGFIVGAFILMALLFASFLIRRHVSVAPFAFIGGLWTVCLILMSLFVKTTRLRVAAVWTAAVIAAPTIFETVLWLQPGTYGNDAYVYRTLSDDTLGYRPWPSRTYRAVVRNASETIFDVAYTIDSLGLRVTPEATGDGCVLFFGGSFTFGEGVEDAESLPYQVGMRVARTHKAYNFGVGGYGPHQMLAALQSGYVSRRAECKGHTVIVFQALVGHARRVAGLAPHDRLGPRYVLSADGGVTHAGVFAWSADWRNILTDLFRKCWTYRRLITRLVTDHDIELMASIVDAAREEALARYPGAEFRVLLWDEPSKESAYLEDLFRRKEFVVDRVTDVLPDFSDNEWAYRIHRDDRHPSALAYSLLAEHVAKSIGGQTRQ